MATMEAPATGIKVRMYRQGHGDCFLLATRKRNGNPFYLLIDCGLKPSSEIRPENKIALALNKMADGGFRHIPLVDGAGHPVGIVAMRDIVGFIVSLFPDAVLTAPPDPAAIQTEYGG